MHKYASCEVYDAELTIKTPVFVGSGLVIGKKSFVIDRNQINVIDMNKLMSEISSRGPIDGFINAFQRFMINDAYNSTGDFLRNFFTSDVINRMTLYSCRSKDVFGGGKPPAEIKQFLKTSDNRPYIPGSSLKGALRTCLIGAKLLDEPPSSSKEIKAKIEAVENEYNKIMKRLSISDSEPVSHAALTLCKKYDVKPSGAVKPLPLVRECLAPGTKLKFRITIDSEDGVLSVDTIKSSIKSFSEFYSDQVKKYYHYPERCGKFDYLSNLILGGGSGYISKTVVYDAAEYKDALNFVINIMVGNFRNHHRYDREYDVSPHTLKYTMYNGLYYPFGICSLTFR